MSAEPGLLARTFEWIRARAIRDNELASMTQIDLGLLATDIGVTEADLREVVPHIGDHSELMNKMMRARGLDPDAVRRAFSGVLRDMEVTCARCREVGTCRAEFKAGTAGAHSHEFCGNTAVMDQLLEHDRAERNVQSA